MGTVLAAHALAPLIVLAALPQIDSHELWGVGRSVLSIADLSGDGIADFLTTSQTRPPGSGAFVWLFSGSDLTLISRFETCAGPYELALSGTRSEQQLWMLDCKPGSRRASLLRHRVSDWHCDLSIELEAECEIQSVRIAPDTASRDRCDRTALYCVGDRYGTEGRGEPAWIWRVDLESKIVSRLPFPELEPPRDEWPAKPLSGSARTSCTSATPMTASSDRVEHWPRSSP